MNTTQPPFLRIPQNIRDDVAGYRRQAQRFLAGEITPVAFKAYRVPMGIYEQRQSNTYMVRIRIGAGWLRDYQLERIAQLSQEYGNGVVHVTTRQDLQIHQVQLEHTADILEGLLEIGLSARGGGGNTVRNITACPRGGVCPNEKFDVAPYALALAEYLLSFDSSYNLPRKFKIAFSGCARDCAYAGVADLGFFAHVRHGQPGFAVYGGGGLGPQARVAVLLEEFVPAEEIFRVAESVKRLFDKHGDRKNRHQARLRYVIDRVGEEKFRELYRNEKAALEQETLKTPDFRSLNLPGGPSPAEVALSPEPPSLPAYALPEKTPGYCSLKLKLENGDISADDACRIAALAREFSHGTVRTTQFQDIMLTSISVAHLETIHQRLRQLTIDVLGLDRTKIITCTGAATCKLGLCLSRGLAQAITEEFRSNHIVLDENRVSIKISGCPNSCGGHFIADLGLQGKAKRVHGRLMPYYDIFTGANLKEGSTRLAQRIGHVPAHTIPALLAQVFHNGKMDGELLGNLIEKHQQAPADVPESYYYDFGASQPFSLAGRGPGECGVGVTDVIRFDLEQAKGFLDAKNASDTAGNPNESIYQALLAAARSLLIIYGQDPKNDVAVFRTFQEKLIDPGWVAPQTRTFLDDALAWKMGQKASLEDMRESLGKLLARIEELFLSLDANLTFRAEKLHDSLTGHPEAPVAGPGQTEHQIDLRGVTCPMNFVKAKLALEKIPTGEVLEFLLDSGAPVENVPASFADQQQEVLKIEPEKNHYRVTVRRLH